MNSCDALNFVNSLGRSLRPKPALLFALVLASGTGPLKADPIYTWSTAAGQLGVAGSADGAGSAARFYKPEGAAVDGAGNVYVADTYNHTIRKVTGGGVVTTLAGTAGQPGSVDGTGSAARFYHPAGVAVDSAGNVYVADSYNSTLRKVTSGGVVTTLAGSAGQYGSADGTGNGARFHYPFSVAVDSAGNLYVADYGNSTIRKVTRGGVVTTLAGSPGQVGSSDGAGSAARFNSPSGVAVDSAGNAYVVDRYNHTIRKVTSGGLVTTLGGGPGQFGGADGTGSSARFYYPFSVAVDSAGNLYVADTWNNAIRQGVALPRLTIAPAGSGNVTVTWSAGVLQAADVVTGPFSDVLGATSPCTNSATGVQKFYRLR